VDGSGHPGAEGPRGGAGHGTPVRVASLTVVRGPDAGAKFTWDQSRVILGRKKGDFLVADRETSGSHASIEVLPDGRFVLKDLGSTNGTYLDGRRVTIAELKSGQQLKCGANYILFTVAEDDSGVTAHAMPAHDAAAWAGSSASAAGPGLEDDLPEIEPFGELPAPAVPHLAERASPPATGAASAPGAAADLEELPLPPGPPPPRVGITSHGEQARERREHEKTVLSPTPVVPPLAPPPPAPREEASRLPPGVERSVYGLYLVVERGRDQGAVFPVNRDVTVIGRSQTDIVLNDPDISRRHAAIDVQGRGNYVLRDLRSTNGTLLNGRRIASDVLADNDKVRLGGTTMKFVVGEDRVAVELERLQSG